MPFLVAVHGADAVANTPLDDALLAVFVLLALGWLGGRIADVLRDLPPE